MGDVPHQLSPDTGSDLGSIFSGAYRSLTLGIIAIMTIVAFEGMGVITAMPAAARDLGGLELYGWGSTAFAVAGLFAMATAGGWADRSGPVPPLTTGLVIFVGGLVVSGSAVTMPMLLAGRGLQGLGFGGVIVALYVVIGRAYPESLRPRVFTALSGAWVIPGITGPLIAGVVTETVGWRWVFYGVLLLLVPVAFVLVPRLRSLHVEPDADADPTKGRIQLAFMAAFGAGLLQFAGQKLDWVGLLVAVPAVVLLAVSLPRLLPAGAFQLRRGLPTVVILRGFFAGAFFAVEWFIPLILVSERSLSYALAGGALSGAALGWFTGSWYQGRPSTKIPRYRLVTLGGATTTLGIALSTLVLFQAVPWWIVVFTWTIGSLGMGVLYGSLGVLLLELSSREEQGVNSAALQMSDSLGVIACTGLAGVVFAAGLSPGGENSAVYFVIFAMMVTLAVFATSISPRVRPRSS